MNFYSQVRRPAGVQGIIIARRMNQNHRGMMEWALERMDLSRLGRMLDLGCGGGGPLSMLSGKARRGEYVALDLSRDMLRMTCKVNATLKEEGRLDRVKGSVQALPFRDGAFDSLLVCETTYFWPDLASDLKECRRVLSPQGTLFMVQETWDAPQWRERNESWQKGFRMNFFSLEEYQNMLREAGFASVVTETEEEQGWFVMTASGKTGN